jgi:hypothetical protein
MKYLIPYLGFENYLVTIESSKRYHLVKNPGHKVIEEPDPFEGLRPKATEVED